MVDSGREGRLEHACAISGRGTHTDSKWFADGGFVIGVDLDGRIVHSLRDDDHHFLATTTALEHDGHLYLGSVVMNAIGRIRLPSSGSSR